MRCNDCRYQPRPENVMPGNICWDIDVDDEYRESCYEPSGMIWMGEYVLEIESFKSEDEATKFAQKHISPGGKTVNVVSRDITVLEITDQVILMPSCANCGTNLYALNISDADENLCQGCANKIIDSMYQDSLETTLVLWESKRRGF